MLVPAFFHGRARDVRAACRRKVTQLGRGAAWDELAGELADTRERPGLLVLNGGPLTGGGEHFHSWLLAQAIENAVPTRLPEEIFVTLFEPMIATNWGFLLMLGQWGRSFLFPPGHQQRFLHLLIRWWDELQAEGRRYSTGSNVGSHLWDLFTNIHFCLAREGLPREVLDAPVPPGGMAELVAQTRAGLPPGPAELH